VSANASVGSTPPCWTDIPGGSQPNDRLVTSGLNWDGAATGDRGREYARAGTTMTRAATSAATSARRRPGRPGASAAGAPLVAGGLEVYLGGGWRLAAAWSPRTGRGSAAQSWLGLPR
jgi:hypothetical protein